MGKKRTKNSSSSSSYCHIHRVNPIARESDERRTSQLQSLEIKRLLLLVEKQENEMKRFIPKEKRKKPRIGILIVNFLFFFF